MGYITSFVAMFAYTCLVVFLVASLVEHCVRFVISFLFDNPKIMKGWFTKYWDGADSDDVALFGTVVLAMSSIIAMLAFGVYFQEAMEFRINPIIFWAGLEYILLGVAALFGARHLIRKYKK